MDLFLKIAGAILVIAGFLLVLKPNLFSFSPDVDGYQMIEKRVKWGILIGIGIFLIVHTDWTFWSLTVTGFLTALTVGIIFARLTGYILDGFFIKQLWWLLIELVALVLFGFLYWKQIK